MLAHQSTVMSENSVTLYRKDDHLSDVNSNYDLVLAAHIDEEQITEVTLAKLAFN